MHHITKSLSLKTDVEKIFAFHLNPKNLRLILPRYPLIKIISISHSPLQKESEIKIKLNVLPFVGVNWVIVIESIIENKLIVDIQKKGPFKYWKHKHKFENLFDGTTIMTDEIAFEIGFGIIGKILSPIIKSQIEKMFESRHNKMELLFGG
ncbi:MAG: SRPBCC family protein [Ignavibacteria bacterium]|nr:SRPBCC family protein [Ignavibacteria bacterium]